MALGGYVFRTFRSNTWRNLLGIAAVVVTVWLMVTVGVLFNVAIGTFTDLFTQEAGFDLLVGPADQTTSDLGNLSYVDVEDISTEMRAGGATETYPLVTQVMLTFNSSSTFANGTFLILYGAEEGYDQGTELDMEGEYELDGDGCVLSTSAAQDLEVGVDDVISVIGYQGELNFSANFSDLMMDPEFQDRLIVENWTVRGIIDVRGRFLQGIESFIVKDIEQVQDLYGIQGRANWLLGLISEDEYDLNDPENPAGGAFNLAKGIALTLGPDYVVTAPRAQAIEASLEATRATNVIAYLFSIVFPFIAGIMIASILNLSVDERAKDLATMRLLGARRKLVGRVVGGELAIMLSLGIPIGVALGVGLPLVAQAMGMEALPEDSSRVVDWSVVLGQVLITLAITSLFALAPLRKAMATTPAEAISGVRSEGRYRWVSQKGVDRRFLLAAFLLFIALVYATFFIPYFIIYGENQFFSFFIFSFLIILLSFCVWMLVAVPLFQRGLVLVLQPLLPRSFKLVRANLERYVRRNASTTLIFAIIVAIMLFFSSFFIAIQSSIETQSKYGIGADILLASEGGLPLDLVEGIDDANYTASVASTTPQVDARMSDPIYSSSRGVDVFAIYGELTSATFVSEDDVYRGEVGTINDVGPNGCVVSRALASVLDVGLGDTVGLDYEDHRLFLKVRLILESLPGFAGDFPEQPEDAGGSGVIVSLATYAKLTGVDVDAVTYDRIFIDVAEGEDHQGVGNTLHQRYRVYFNIFVIVTVTVVEQAKEGLSILNSIFYLILIILMVVAFFSLYMNLLASILEREYELGIVRSLGLRAGALRNALIAEGLTTAVVAMFVGIVVGTSLSLLIIAFFNMLSPIDFAYVPPWFTLLSLVVITVVMAIIATYSPARSVARRAVVDLIRRAA